MWEPVPKVSACVSLIAEKTRTPLGSPHAFACSGSSVADHRVGRHQFGKLGAVDARRLDDLVAPAASRAAPVVGQQHRECGADVRRHATGEARGEIVHRLDVRVCRGMDLGALALEPQHVRERVAAAAARRHAVSLEPELPEFGMAFASARGSARRRACRGRAPAARAGGRPRPPGPARSTGCRRGSRRRGYRLRAPPRARA